MRDKWCRSSETTQTFNVAGLPDDVDHSATPIATTETCQYDARQPQGQPPLSRVACAIQQLNRPVDRRPRPPPAVCQATCFGPGGGRPHSTPVMRKF